MAEDMANREPTEAELRAEQYQVDMEVWDRLRRTTLEWEGRFGVDANGTLTTAGYDLLKDALRAAGFRFART